MSNIVKITDFQSVFSNGNRDEIDPRFMTALKNLRPLNGKLVKTFGFGEKIGTAASWVVQNIYTYVHDELSGDELYILVYISGSDNAVGLYAWSGSNWVALNSISGVAHSGTYYHDSEKNPIVYEGGRLRFLPGAIAESPTAGYDCEGIWLGYIDRSYFDGNYSPTAGFYSAKATVDAPSLDFTTTLYDAGEDDGGNERVPPLLTAENALYYRFSYVYDGVAESLLSDPVVVRFTPGDTNKFVEFEGTITKTSHNKRVTGMKAYVSTDSDTGFRLAANLDFTRAADTVAEDTDGGVLGDNFAYISNLTHTINPSYSYRLTKFSNGATYYSVTPRSVGGEYIFEFDSHSGANTEFEKIWNNYDVTAGANITWYLFEDTGGGFDMSEGNHVDSGATGLFCGEDVVIVEDDLGTGSCADGVIIFAGDAAEAYRRIIRDSYKRAVRYWGDVMADATPASPYQAWKVLKTGDGLLYIADDTGDVDFWIYDTLFGDESIQPPWENDTRRETSIKINGKFARVINGRLIQANLVLDPGGENETQNDWLSYSEYQQYDVNPVSNVISFSYKSGGEITGLAELFGNPVVMKQQSIVYLDTKSNPDKPHLWKVIESAHNIGNLADEGYIEASGSLYVCYEDGIYRLSPNNLAPTDATPAERLRVSEPIGDVYANLTTAQKAAIKAGYNPLTSEVMFTLDEEVWAFNISSGQWREIDTGVTPGLFGEDENGQAMIFQNSDKKIYSPADDESVTCELATKTFVLDNERDRTVRRVAVNYKSAAALTCKIYYDDEVPSGDIQNGVEYAVNETPYVDGATFEVTYNGTAYNHGDTFDGTIGKHDYTTSGTGVVEHYSNHTLPANNALTSYRFRVGRWAKRLRIEITGTTGTTDVEITGIELVYD